MQKKVIKTKLGKVQDLLQDFKKGQQLFTSAKSSMDQASQILQKSMKAYQDIEAEAKSLGIDLNNDIKRIGNSIQELLKETQSFK